jgi:hypothetical protein
MSNTKTVDYTYPIGSFGLKATLVVSGKTGVVFAPFNHKDKLNGFQTTHFSGTSDQIDHATELLNGYVLRRQRWLVADKNREPRKRFSPTPTPTPPPSVWTPVCHGISFASKVLNWIPDEDEIQADMDEILDAIIQLPGITNEMKGEMEAEEIFLDMYFEETEPSLFENFDEYFDKRAMTTYYPIARYYYVM